MIKEGTVKDEDITKIVAYLETLKPEGGCPVITGVNADKVHRLADDGGGGTTAQDSSDSANSVTGPAPTPEIGYVNEARFKS
jgi:hypothetical protein